MLLQEKIKEARYLDILASKFDWDYRNQSSKWNSLEPETKEFLDAFFKTSPNLRKELILNNLKPCNQKIFNEIRQKYNQRSSGRGR